MGELVMMVINGAVKIGLEAYAASQEQEVALLARLAQLGRDVVTAAEARRASLLSESDKTKAAFAEARARLGMTQPEPTTSFVTKPPIKP